MILAFLFIVPLASAINLKIEGKSSNEVMIANIDEPATFDIEITNLGLDDSLQFYNLLGFNMAPKGTVNIKSGETQRIKVLIYPRPDLNFKGFYTFKYFIRGKDSSEITQKITVKIMDLEEIFEVGSEELNPPSNSMRVYIKNKVNFNFEEAVATFSSPFFEFDEKFSLAPYEKKTFDVKLNKEDFKKLMAGFYTLKAEITVDNKNVDVEGVIKFAEKDIVTTTKKDYGLIISTKIIEKKNEGNTIAKSETAIKKNIISRLFTNFSPEPNIVERDGFSVYYTWNNEINPGETLKITTKTNWLFPFLTILFIIAIVMLAKLYSKTNLVLRKKVSFVRAKGGEFALKVSIIVDSKKYIERISVVDRIPQLVKIYERFGGEKPARIDEKNKKIEWNFEKLEAGEIRVLSYIIYSKVGVLGKFALPSAKAIYEREGEVQEAESNRAFFISEQRGEEGEE